jgi:bacterioferritin-associated ferredoxin
MFPAPWYTECDMELDDNVCLCFRVSKRKLLNFARREKPKVASQLSQCGGAGTGCGWCVPFLKKLFLQSADGGSEETPTAEEYARQRAEYVKSGKGKPPEGATPSPE